MIHKKKLLFISPFPRDQDLYPHYSVLIDELSNFYEVEYFPGKERGLNLHRLTQNIISLNSCKFIIKILIDIIKLWVKRRHKFEVVLAVDNLLFIIACATLNVKTILFSCDFVSYDQNELQSFANRITSILTKKYLDQGRYLIIQDIERLNLLQKTLKTEIVKEKIFFLPISLPSVSKEDRKNILRISKSPILLQLGGINSWRSGSDKLIDYYQSFNQDFLLYLHGFIEEDIQNKIYSLDSPPIVSSIRINPLNIYKIVQRCDIGFICYETEDLNFYYISMASGQLVEFLRCGKPIITLGNTNLGNFIDNKKIGIEIMNMNQLSDAINFIMSDYSKYSENCIQTFNDFFDISSYHNKLVNFLEQDTRL